MFDQIEFKDIRNFVQIARAGSLTRAAKETNTPKATLSHSLRRLEDALGVELVTRHRRGLQLTESGQAYLQQSTLVFQSCELAASAAQRASAAISGRLRIIAGAEFGTSIIGAVSFYLARQHPELQFDLKIFSSERLLERELDFDCLIYVGTAPNSDCLCRKMGKVNYGLYASPAYIARFGMPNSPEDIADLPGVQYERLGIPEAWLVMEGKGTRTIEFQRRFTVNDYWMAKYFAVLGEGIAYLPDFFVHYEEKMGALVPVMPGKRPTEVSVWVIYPSSRYQTPRVRKMVDALISNFDEIILLPGYSLVNNSSPD